MTNNETIKEIQKGLRGVNGWMETIDEIRERIDVDYAEKLAQFENDIETMKRRKVEYEEILDAFGAPYEPEEEPEEDQGTNEPGEEE